jgi:hypothetical protein
LAGTPTAVLPPFGSNCHLLAHEDASMMGKFSSSNLWTRTHLRHPFPTASQALVTAPTLIPTQAGAHHCCWRVARLPETEAGDGIVMVRDEAQARALFQERYGNRPSSTTREIERRVIGGDWGANGFTTMAQADTLARELGLSAGDRLLDLGSGRGWPGLYLAATTGCQVVLTDLPVEGLRVAANRATSEGLATRTNVVAAAASGLPFWPGSFDVVIHTDVLC